jgi:hypothetical protein
VIQFAVVVRAPPLLTVARTGTGADLGTVRGTVVDALGVSTVIDCSAAPGSICLAEFARGSKVTLTATVAPGGHFDGWGGACAAFGTGTCTLTMDGDQNVEARFSAGAPPPPPPPGADFTLSASPTSVTVSAGQRSKQAAGQSTITVNPVNGFMSPVTFTTSTSSGITASVSPKSSSTSTTLSVGALSTAAAGSYSVVVTGSSGELARSTSVTVHVIAAGSPDFTLNANPSSVSVPAGAGVAESTISVNKLNGFNGLVTFTSNPPAGITAEISPTESATDATLTLSADAGTAAGTYQITVTGTSGVMSHSTTVNVQVTGSGSPDFSLSANPPGISVIAGGANVQSTIKVNPANGFAGAVGFSVPQHDGLTANVEPLSSATGTTLTVSAPSETAAGAYHVTVTGSAFVAGRSILGATGTITHSLDIPVTVTNRGSSDNWLTVSSGNGIVTSVAPHAEISCRPNASVCSHSYAAGTVVVLHADPGTIDFPVKSESWPQKYRFTGWSGACTGVGDCTVTMHGDRQVSANFTYPVRTLGWSALPGTLTRSSALPPAGENAYPQGTQVKVLSDAAYLHGLSFLVWGGACAGMTSLECPVILDEDKNVFSSWSTPGLCDEQHRQLWVLAGNGGAEVSGRQDGLCEPLGAEITLHADVNPLYGFHWEGACSGTSRDCKVTIDKDTEVVPIFDTHIRLLTVSSGNGVVRADESTPTLGRLSQRIQCGSNDFEYECAMQLEFGSDNVRKVTLTEEPDSGYRFDGWSGGGCSGTGPCTVTMNDDISVAAKFSHL